MNDLVTLIQTDARTFDVRALGRIDLLLADPPWLYEQKFGSSKPEDHYEMLTNDDITKVLFADDGRKVQRTAVWCTWATSGEWLMGSVAKLAPHVGPWATGGSWDKGPHTYGQGFHWAGRTEPILVWTRRHGPPLYNHAVERQGRPAILALDNGTQTSKSVHSAKPIQWMRQMIRRWVPPGGLVFDPFGGTGTVPAATLLAGEGRRCVMLEVLPGRVELARERVSRTLAELAWGDS